MVMILLSIISLIISFNKKLHSANLKILFILRLLSITLLIILLFNPQFSITKRNEKKLEWNIYIDNSLSMSYHSAPSMASLKSGIDDIIDYLDKSFIPFNVYGFGQELDSNWFSGLKDFKDGSTNFGSIVEHMQSNSNRLAGSVVITDGQVNQGPEIESKISGLVKPIHLIGVGSQKPLVDVLINSIEAPPVIIKGETAELIVSVASYGVSNQRLNVTLYSESKLLGSKIIQADGEGSNHKIRFMINPLMTGEIEYKVQVNALPEEINILNNKQLVSIQVLKNEYRIALITGAPSFNTRIIKDLFSNHKKFKLEHFYFRDNKYSKPLKQFWDTRYDLIVFDNHPINLNSDEWNSYLRIFAKKLLSQKTSFSVFIGNEINKNSIEKYLSLMDLGLKESLIDLQSNYEWNFTSDWDSLFPFHNINSLKFHKNDLPPLNVDMQVSKKDNNNFGVLAKFSISEVSMPLLIISEKTPLRYLVWTSPDLFKLHYKSYNKGNTKMIDAMFKPIFSWLIRTGDGRDFYFRTEKNSYQQGERISMIGKPIKDAEIAKEGYVHIYNDDNKINSKPISFNSSTGFYESNFWASQSGNLDYKVQLIYGNQPVNVAQGKIQIQESQIELNNVYLNREPLVRIADNTGGSYSEWIDRSSLMHRIENKSETEFAISKIILHQNISYFLLILVLLTIEWFMRKKIGML